jgi:hypothetical protein
MVEMESTVPFYLNNENVPVCLDKQDAGFVYNLGGYFSFIVLDQLSEAGKDCGQTLP